ncbi:hypothetical protein KO493_03250 [Tamlana agarivorans]|uniref:Uncharacterized protein n=1 Tax=Pseudotamlana agarivorans TaxID=481183 RepID=A0ACC5U5X9_9FLAO|nr:hypothetical protein [Tamlana agarivorans]MBU2949710.1 hypothetical protein [Tamlana agarivorans]
MKKIRNNEKNLNFNRAKKHHKRKLTFKKKKKKKRKRQQGLNKAQRKQQDLYETKYKDYVKIKSPDILSFVKNPEGTNTLIHLIKKQYLKRKKVFVILKHVEILGYDALVVLLSILIRFKAKGIPFNGDMPDNFVARKILVNSGFLDYLYRNIKSEDRYELLKGGTISTHAWKKVDAELTHQIISDASLSIWGEKRRFQGVQRSLIELMHNTNNHAVYGKEGDKHWFLSVQHLPKENKVCFSFIDFGVGIFDSLNNKGEESKWYGWRSPLSKIFTFNNNKELLKLILNGDLHKTVTGKYYRGKGLPGIYDAFKRNDFSKLHIISNDVFADVKNNDFRTLTNKFSGTFVYWELNKSNTCKDGID